jgi:putative aldouronate transport system substrate-binding protein
MKRIIAVVMLIGAILVPSVFSAGRKEKPGGIAGDKLSIMVPLWSPEGATSENPTWKKLEELTNEKLDLLFVPSDSYKDKLNVSIAAGELPDAFGTLDFKGNIFVNAARGGMFWEVRDAINKTANLSKNLTSQILDSAVIDGKNYYIPKTINGTRIGYLYRKDWFEKLGLKKPETINDLYEVIKAFATRDPDGNGKNDTYGLISAASDNGPWNMYALATANGAGNNFILEGGQIIPSFSTKPYFEILELFRKMYSEKLINQDFATIRQEKGFELFNAEQGGMVFAMMDELGNRFEALLAAKKANNPNLVLGDIMDFVPRLKGSDGAYHIASGSVVTSAFAIPKTSVKTEERFARVMKFFDNLESDQTMMLIKYGIEGIDWERTRDNKVVRINPEKYSVNVHCFLQLGPTSFMTENSIPLQRDPLMQRVQDERDNNVKYAVMDITFPLFSETYITRNVELQKIMTDAQIQYIMGQIDESGYWEAYDRWKRNGGQKIIDEFTSDYKKSH